MSVILQHDYLDVDVDEINRHPTKYSVELSGKSYSMVFRYNNYADCYYVSLYDQYDVLLVATERIVYGMPLFGDIVDPRLPIEDLIPIDESNQANEVTKETFGNSVFLVYSADLDNNSDDDGGDNALTDSDGDNQ